MEAQLSFVVIPLFVLLLLHWFVKYYTPKSNLAYKLPPGPRKLPLIGNLHQLALAGKLPHHALRDLANKYGPIMHLQLGEISTIVVSSPKIAKEILKTHDVAFANRPQLLSPQIMAYGSIDIVFSPYGEYWKQMRKICVLELLSAKRVQSFSYIREDETRKLIESIKSSLGSTINLTSRIFSLITCTISRAALGDKTDEFVSCVRKVVELSAELSAGFYLPDLFPSIKPIHMLSGIKTKLEKIHKRVDRIMENILIKHEEKKRGRARAGEGSEAEQEDLVDVLLRVQQSGNLDIQITSESIKAVIWDVFVAGIGTSAATIEWAMSEMMKNPRVMEKAQGELRQKMILGKKTSISESDIEELNYLKLVIKETLRLHPPSPLLVPRECRETTNIDGYEIPIKSKVMINAWAMGRDPEHWKDAESFIPERFDGSLIDFKGNNFEYIPFGAGRRMCPGISFGSASVVLPLALLLYHFNWELPNNMKHEDLDMTESEHFGLAIGRKSELCLIPTIYHA